jgi:hypothetical protein
MSDVVHALRIEDLGILGHRAKCSCMWISERRFVWSQLDELIKDHENHVEEEKRKKYSLNRGS